MPTDTMNPVTAVTWGPFIQAASAQYTSDPSQLNPATIADMPAGYALVRTIQMTDFFGPEQSRVFYGFVAVGGDPTTAVVALRGTETNMEWWDDFHWDLVPFTQVSGGGKVAEGFCDIYDSIGTMTPGQPESTSAPTPLAADVAGAATSRLAAGVDPAALPMVVTGHSLGGALATLLVADLTANTALKPQAWTFASPKVGEMVFTQLAKRAVRASGGGWQDVADLGLVVGDDHSVDEQFGQLPPLRERGRGESGPDGPAEGLDAVGHGLQFEALFSGGVQLALLGRQGGLAAVQFFSFALEFAQGDDLGEVGVQQPLLLAA